MFIPKTETYITPSRGQETSLKRGGKTEPLSSRYGITHAIERHGSRRVTGWEGGASARVGGDKREDQGSYDQNTFYSNTIVKNNFKKKEVEGV